MIWANDERPGRGLLSRRGCGRGDALRRRAGAARRGAGLQGQNIRAPRLQTTEQEAARQSAEFQVLLAVHVVHLKKRREGKRRTKEEEEGSS